MPVANSTQTACTKFRRSTAISTRRWSCFLPVTIWDGIVPVSSSIAPGFWFDVFGGYKITSDEVFFAPTLLAPSVQGDIFANTSRALQANAKHAFGGVNLKYSYQQLFDINLKGVYNSWNVDDIEDAHGKPEMELTAGITVRPISQVTASLDYYLATGRKTFLGRSEGER